MAAFVIAPWSIATRAKIGEKRPAERDRAVAAVAVALRESSPQTGPEEDEKERDERCHQEGDDLVLASVVLPVGERLGRPCLAGRTILRRSDDARKELADGREEEAESEERETKPFWS